MKTQQLSLYDSERTTNRGTEFTEILDVAAWVGHMMLDAPWWHERFPCVRGIKVEAARRGDGSTGGWFPDDCTGQIEMSPGHWCARYLCHEVAHVAANSDGQSHGHDPVFAATYLELVFRCMGTDAWLELREAFVRDGIEFS